MAAGVKDIIIEQGATFIMNVTFTTNGTIPVDITGYAGRGYLKSKASSTTNLAEFDVDITDPTEGVIAITMDADTTRALPTKGASYAELTNAVYDIELYQGEEVIRLLNGIAQISPEVTKEVIV
jgi:hypothetical protein